MAASVSPAERIYRARRIGTTFGRVYLGIKANQFIAARLRPPDMRRRWSRFNRDSAEAIYDAAVELRGLILKGCQFLGSRADVLPPEYVNVLSRLQDRVPPRSFGVVRRCVERELGGPLEDTFEEFAERPLASASLAQVHAARLRGGEPVAVKVQYPEISALVRSDLANLRALFRIVGWLEREIDVMPLVEELQEHVPRELDFVNEGRNAERIASFFAGRGDVVVPRVHWGHTTRRVLVMERMHGVKITDLEGLAAAGVEPDWVARTLVEVYCEQILAQGFFHADPHPGNLLIEPPSGGRGPRLVLLDFGLAKELPPDFRRAVVAFAMALLRGDPDAMARALVLLGFQTRDGRVESLAEISRVLLDVATRFRDQAWVDSRVAREAAEELPRLIRENPIVRVPSHVVLLGRVLGLLSGVGRSLGARVDMVATVLPYAFATQPRDPASA
jgi:predicted unusual protein kinase regulating ubiquinone biosynthesis (AarF/ABC1/UbiB family)